MYSGQNKDYSECCHNYSTLLAPWRKELMFAICFPPKWNKKKSPQVLIYHFDTDIVPSCPFFTPARFIHYLDKSLVLLIDMHNGTGLNFVQEAVDPRQFVNIWVVEKPVQKKWWWTNLHNITPSFSSRCKSSLASGWPKVSSTKSLAARALLFCCSIRSLSNDPAITLILPVMVRNKCNKYRDDDFV